MKTNRLKIVLLIGIAFLLTQCIIKYRGYTYSKKIELKMSKSDFDKKNRFIMRELHNGHGA